MLIAPVRGWLRAPAPNRHDGFGSRFEVGIDAGRQTSVESEDGLLVGPRHLFSIVCVHTLSFRRLKRGDAAAETEGPTPAQRFHGARSGAARYDICINVGRKRE
jgi:hypothetical protein